MGKKYTPESGSSTLPRRTVPKDERRFHDLKNLLPSLHIREQATAAPKILIIQAEQKDKM
jgi:hypothetical protein